MQGYFTLSYHYFRQQDSRNHLELFLDVDGKSALETWRYFPPIRRERLRNAPARFVAAPDHRRVYLDFSGLVSGNRGRLRILRKGKFIDRRARRAEVDTAHEVHLGLDRRAHHIRAKTIQVTL